MLNFIKKKIAQKYPYQLTEADILTIHQITEKHDYRIVFDRNDARQELLCRKHDHEILEYDIDAELLRHQGTFDYMEYDWYNRPEAVKSLTKIYQYRMKVTYSDQEGNKYENILHFESTQKYEKNDRISICYKRDEPDKIQLPYEVMSDRDLKRDLILYGLLVLTAALGSAGILLLKGKSL